MDLLYLSHCTPDAPDKGEKIRAFHELNRLTADHRVHLVCFARTDKEADSQDQMARSCASVHIERLDPIAALPRVGLGLAFGHSLVACLFRSRRMSAHIRRLSAHAPLRACVAFSSVMAPYSPPGLPLVVDMVDVDSEKWSSYADLRQPRFLFATESKRLRKLEASIADQASCVLLSTAQEAELYRSFAPDARVRVLENGIDTAYFDPLRTEPLPELAGRRYLLFVGAMDYFPNRDAVSRFAREILPTVRQHHPDIEFLIVGRSPSNEVLDLSRLPGVEVVGAVPDVRPYVYSSLAVLAPLNIARGIQNKVLEALAMGKPTFASPGIVRTFGESTPPGVWPVSGADETLDAISRVIDGSSIDPARIRDAAAQRFRWDRNLTAVLEEIERAADK